MLQSKRALFLLLKRFLYAAILITTCLQYASDAEPKMELPSTPDSLMMSVGATPLSIYLRKQNSSTASFNSPYASYYVMPKLYLLGGENVSLRSAKSVNELAFMDAGGRPNILVVPWARPSFDKAYGKRKLLEDYFRSMGAESVEFADYDEIDLAQKIAEANLIYLTGGQASILIERAQKMHLETHLKNYQGIIVGRSAGALALCNHCITTRRYSKKVAAVNGLGLTNLTLKAHYIAADEEKLKQFSKSEHVYAVPKDSALIVENGKLSAIGEVYLFNGGARHLFVQGCL